MIALVIPVVLYGTALVADSASHARHHDRAEPSSP